VVDETETSVNIGSQKSKLECEPVLPVVNQCDTAEIQRIMPHAYTEDQLVEQPAIGLFAELGWSTVSALEETFWAERLLPTIRANGRLAR
jgi:hypothetical protein